MTVPRAAELSRSKRFYLRAMVIPMKLTESH